MGTPIPKILSLDGGGIRGVSSLLILQKIMEQIDETAAFDHPPRPCEVFDLIGGSSTGGIIAIMLGRLGMTVEECLAAYRALAKVAFSPKLRIPIPVSPKGAYSAKALETAIKQAIMRNCKEQECLTQGVCCHSEKLYRDSFCVKTIVLALTKNNIDSRPTLFKTYDTSKEFQACPIWQIARATSAAPTFFRSIKVGRDGIDFVDPGLGYNNPCEVLIEEAGRVFPTAQDMKILSIGTGLGGPVRIQDARLSILKALKKLGTESNKVARRLEAKYSKTSYFRLNVDNGLEDVTIDDWKMDSDISTHTHNYLKENQAEIRLLVTQLTNATTQNQVLGEPLPTAARIHQSERLVQPDNSHASVAEYHFAIMRNISSWMAEQVNSIKGARVGKGGHISDNRSTWGSKQWNTVVA